MTTYPAQCARLMTSILMTVNENGSFLFYRKKSEVDPWKKLRTLISS